MSQAWIYTIVYFAWLIGAACFVLGLHLMNSPATGRNGNRLSASGMVIAVGATLVDLIARPEGLSTIALVIIVVGFLLGGAAALVAIDDFIKLAGLGGGGADLSTTVFVVLGAVFGSVTFTGSLIAGGK